MGLVHTDSLNLARRMSARAENDLVQENMYDDEEVSREYCQGIASKLTSLSKLPDSCKQYPDIVKTLERRTTGSKEDASIAFQGMRAGSAAAARAARSKGQEHHAQVQRRYTQSGRKFSKKD